MRMMTLGLIAVLGLAGCEPIQGAGRDTRKPGQTLEKAGE